MALRRFVFAFGTAFAVCYAIAVGRQLALFTVFPSLGIVLPGTVQSRDVADPALGFLARAMYWYGWTATATLGALAAGGISLAVPEALDSMGLAGIAVANSGRGDGRLRGFHIALVSALTGEVAAVLSSHLRAWRRQWRMVSCFPLGTTARRNPRSSILSQKQGSAEFVPPAGRVATFDNDGTLWCEQPLQIQFFFAFDRVKQLSAKDPTMSERHPFRAVLEHDCNTLFGLGEMSLHRCLWRAIAPLLHQQGESLRRLGGG